MISKKLLNDLKKGTNETRRSKLKGKTDAKRWEIAQNSEEEFWEDYTTESLLNESRDRYPKKAEILLEDWSHFTKTDKNTKILQIGCGPEDVINYFKEGERYSIDPLADFYKKRFKFDYESSNLKKGRGEEIPFPDEYFNVVILINVLDHTELPDRVFSEIKRVLKNEGIFHLENYIYQKKFIYIAKIYGKLKEILTREIFNIHHPYMFTLNDIQVLISKNFVPVKEEIGRDIGLYENIDELKKLIETQESLPKRILAKFGLLGIINYMIICKKK
ncbi:MAG: class I SAM-dependent methyltransferase [archaeon]